MAEQNAKEADIILFDGECMMCSAIVRFVIARDPAGRFRFASLGTDTGAAIRNRFIRGPGMGPAARSGEREKGNVREGTAAGSGMDNIDMPAPDTFMLVRGDRIYMKSRAGLEVVKRLRGAWPLLYAFIAVPAPLRDKVYDYIARNRYRWFGRNDHCILPSPDNKDRFLE